MLNINTTISQTVEPKELFKTVPVLSNPKQQPVEIPGVLNQTRNLYQPYTGRDAKDKS